MGGGVGWRIREPSRVLGQTGSQGAGPRRLLASLPSRLPAKNMAALSSVRWLTRVRPGSRPGEERAGGRRAFTLLTAVFWIWGLQTRLTGCVSVAGAGRRPEPRGMERPVYFGRGALRLAEPGKLKARSGLAPTPITPHLRPPGLLLLPQHWF